MNPFVPNQPFLYLKVFWCFQELERGCIENKCDEKVERSRKQKNIFSDLPGHNILKLYNVLRRFVLPHFRCLIVWKSLYIGFSGFSHEWSTDLRLRILGNQEILGKSQNWVDTEIRAQSLCQRQTYVDSGRKLCQSKY